MANAIEITHSGGQHAAIPTNLTIIVESSDGRISEFLLKPEDSFDWSVPVGGKISIAERPPS